MTKKYLLPEERGLISWNQVDQADYIYDVLQSYSHSSVYPLHMPGHKRNTKKFGDALLYSLDMTESPRMVNLHDPSGLLKRHQEELAKDYGAANSYYMVNGSTGGIISAIRTLTKRKDHLLMTRNAHRSTYHAMEICDLDATFLSPEIDQEFGMYASISPKKVETLLDRDPKITCVFITSPTFEGVISDVRAIADVVHAHGARLIVDEAHGAHFHYSHRYKDAIHEGADIVIESLHKTLPSLTATAVLHISERVDSEEMARNLAIFETSSPSHLLLASCDECIGYMRSEGARDLDNMYRIIDKVSHRLEGLEKLEVLGMGRDRKENHPLCYDMDPSKIIISTKAVTVKGIELNDILRQRGFELEMGYGDYSLAMVTLGDTEEGLLRFADTLLEVDKELRYEAQPQESIFPEIPQKAMRLLDAWEGPGEFVRLEDSLGRIANEYIWAYPPGIPLLIPGERIAQDILDRFLQLGKQRVKLKSSYGKAPAEIYVVKEG